jgi:hypothetical protein
MHFPASLKKILAVCATIVAMGTAGGAGAQQPWAYPAPTSPGMMNPAMMGMMNPAMMMNPMAFMGPMGPMGMAGSHAPPRLPPAGTPQSAPQGQDVNPYQQWLDAWQQMQKQQGGSAAAQ